MKLPEFWKAILGNGSARDEIDDESERWMRAYLSQMRRRLRSRPGTVVQIDRFARAKARQAKKRLKRGGPKNLEKEVLISRYRPSPILDHLVKDRARVWVDIMRRRSRSTMPSLRLADFSFLTNAAGTLQMIRAIGELEARELAATLNFEDPHCLDAGSFLVLAEIWPKMARVFRGGRMPSSIQKVLAATGVGKHNRMQFKALSVEQDEGFPDVWAFPLQRRRAALSSRSATVHLDPQAREKAADRFCDAVNEWLGVDEIDQELTLEGRAWLANIIGELLCNAERHSYANSHDGDWSTTAFMARRAADHGHVLKCYIAFLSVGRSFAESLADAAPSIREKLSKYQYRHRNCGISADSLATVFALQDTVTCDPEATAAKSGGTGLQDVLEFVDQLGGNSSGACDARVTILSGKTCIALGSDMIPGQRKVEFHPRTQWCNQANSVEDPPDPAVVTDLPDHFAGTLVTIAFTLDPEYLRANVESDDDDGN